MTKTKKEKIKALQSMLQDLDKRSGGAFSGGQKELGGLMDTILREEGATVRAELKDRPVVKALAKLSQDFGSLRKDLDLKPVLKAIEDADSESVKRLKESELVFEEKLGSILDELKMVEERGLTFSATEIQAVIDRLDASQQEYSLDRKEASSKEALLTAEVARLDQEIKAVLKKLGTPKKEDGTQKTLAQNIEDTKQARKVAEEAKSLIEEVRTSMINRIARIQGRGGGNADRSIIVNGSASTLAKYGDINMIASSNLTIAVRTNDTTKNTEFVFSATAGGGGQDFLTVKEVDGNPTVGSVLTIRVSNGTLTDDGSGQVTINTAGGATGIQRVTSIITANTTGGSTASTDYMYFAEDGMTFTLPTAIGNSNLYTVKNMANTSVLLAVSNGQAIDGSNTALLTTQYQSISLQSNGSVWGVV